MCALLHQGSRCAICGGELDLQQPLFATSGVFFPREDPLWRFCDAPMHWDCYAFWKDRPRFARTYFQSWVEAEPRSPSWGKAYLDDALLVTVSPHPPVEEAHLHLSAWGTRTIVKLKDWPSWLAGAEDWMKPLHPWVQNSWKPLLPILLERLPTVESLMQGIDWSLKARRNDELQRRDQAAKSFAQQKLADYNRQAVLLVERMKKDGLLCPGCSRRGNDFKVADGGEKRKTYLVCTACGKSVWPDDLPQS